MNWNDITIGQFQELQNIKQLTYDFEIEKEIAILSALSGQSTEQLEALPKSKLVDLSRKASFINEPMSEKLTSYFRCGSRVFKVNLKAESITAEQYILLNKYTATDESTIENLHYIIAILTNEKKYWVITKKFDYDFEGKSQLFKNELSINKVFASSVFFCKVYKKWLEVSETYLIEKTKEMLQKVNNEMM